MEGALHSHPCFFRMLDASPSWSASNHQIGPDSHQWARPVFHISDTPRLVGNDHVETSWPTYLRHEIHPFRLCNTSWSQAWKSPCQCRLRTEDMWFWAEQRIRISSRPGADEVDGVCRHSVVSGTRNHASIHVSVISTVVADNWRVFLVLTILQVGLQLTNTDCCC